VRVLAEYPDFAASVDRFGTTEAADAALSRLTEMGARLYLANASTHPLVFIHALTDPAAVRLLFPHMPAALREVALAYCWQAIAAWVAAYGRVRPMTRRRHRNRRSSAAPGHARPSRYQVR
jgi:hypothetical protein